MKEGVSATASLAALAAAAPPAGGGVAAGRGWRRSFVKHLFPHHSYGDSSRLGHSPSPADA